MTSYTHCPSWYSATLLKHPRIFSRNVTGLRLLVSSFSIPSAINGSCVFSTDEHRRVGAWTREETTFPFQRIDHGEKHNKNVVRRTITNNFTFSVKSCPRGIEGKERFARANAKQGEKVWTRGIREGCRVDSSFEGSLWNSSNRRNVSTLMPDCLDWLMSGHSALPRPPCCLIAQAPHRREEAQR